MHCLGIRQVAGIAASRQDAALLQHNGAWASLGFQALALAVSLGIAIAGGAAAGLLVSHVNPAGQSLAAAHLFDDGVYWEVRSEQSPSPAARCLTSDAAAWTMSCWGWCSSLLLLAARCCGEMYSAWGGLKLATLL